MYREADCRPRAPDTPVPGEYRASPARRCLILSRHEVLLRLLTGIFGSIKSLRDTLSVMVIRALGEEGLVSPVTRRAYVRAFRIAARAAAYLDDVVNEATRWDPELPKRSWLFLPGRLLFLEETLAASSSICTATVAEVSENAYVGTVYPYDIVHLGLRVDHVLHRARVACDRFLSTVMELEHDWPGLDVFRMNRAAQRRPLPAGRAPARDVHGDA